MVHPSALNDTKPGVSRRQIERWCDLTAAERAGIASVLSVEVAALATAGIRFERPDIPDGEVARELVRRRYGNLFADAAFDRPRTS